MKSHVTKPFVSIKHIFLFVFIFVLILFLHTNVYSQKVFQLRGTIYSQATRQPVEFATIAVTELKKKFYTSLNGSYTIDFDRPGTYTITITSAGFIPITFSIEVTSAIQRDIFLKPIALRGAALTIVEQRNIQTVARYTLTVQDLKTVPASFGDSLNALTSLPGILRTNGFFGPLVIRGTDPRYNAYFIDDIPVYNPQHFGAIHSIINNDIIKEIDVYASNFPSMYGNAIAAVIAINTIDNVSKFGGSADVGIISSNLLLQSPITQTSDQTAKENLPQGYWIASGRYAYLSLFVPTIYKLITGDTIESVPEYWDYQCKLKYSITQTQSLTFLFFGSYDFIKFINEKTPPEEVDPLLASFEFKNNLGSHALGIYYQWQPTLSFENTIIMYGSLTKSYNYLTIPSEHAASWVKDLTVTSKPYIFGIKEKVKLNWWKNYAQLNAAVEYTLYHFSNDGFSLVANQPIYNMPDFGNENLFSKVPLKEKFLNHMISAYAEQRFLFKNITLAPSIRSDYLTRTEQYTFDPRFLISYELLKNTILSFATGKYSSFIQTNSNLFNLSPNLAGVGKEYSTEKAYHNSASIEHKLHLLTIKIEGFYNHLKDLYKDDPIKDSQGNVLQEGQNSGEQKVKGIEILLRLDRQEAANGFFGWINYTYTRSIFRTGTSVDPNAQRWYTYRYEQPHSLKCIVGYVHGPHIVSARFQLYSGFPYTPIVGSIESPPGLGRYVPVYDYSRLNTRRFPYEHRLDLRYSKKTTHEWGYVSWYIEVINIYNYKPKNNISWNYYKPYGSDNPTLKSEEGLSIIPNFGVEVKF